MPSIMNNYTEIKSTSNGTERLFKLIDISLTDVRRHDQKATYYIYSSWVFICFSIIALTLPSSTDKFLIFGISVDNRYILYAFLMPVIIATEYLQKSRLLLRNISSLEFEEAFKALYPEINDEKQLVAYSPGDIIKAERVMNRYITNKKEWTSLNLNTGFTVLLYNVLLVGVIVWLLIEMIKGIEIDNPLLYLSIGVTLLISNKIRILTVFSFKQSEIYNKEIQKK